MTYAIWMVGSTVGPDLHIHSTASDGLLAPEEIVAQAVRRGIRMISLTDHDTVAGVLPAMRAAEGTNLVVVPGVEISSETGGRQVHVLGYWVDPEDPTLLARLAVQQQARRSRAERIVAILQEHGLEKVLLSDVLARARGGSVGRMHVGAAMMAAGYVDSIQEAFERWLGEDRPCYVGKTVPRPADAIRWVREAGGVAVLAHPCLSAVDDLIPWLVSLGLGGIEAYHAECRPEDAERYEQLARESGIIVTGGSDFHGTGRAAGHVGACTVPEWVAHELDAARPVTGV